MSVIADVIHIFGQDAWHDDAYIVGTPEAMKRLRDTIDRALSGGRAEMETFVNDGEGYGIIAIVADPETIDKIGVPYTDEMAAEKSVNCLKHWGLNKLPKKSE